MLVLSVKEGQAVQIGEAAVVAVGAKGGRAVKLTIATAIRPIKVLTDGVIPARFITGLTGRPTRVEGLRAVG